MNADEESRNRQYKGTAMSDDEVSKVYKILSFGICAKSNLKLKGFVKKSFDFFNKPLGIGKKESE